MNDLATYLENKDVAMYEGMLDTFGNFLNQHLIRKFHSYDFENIDEVVGAMKMIWPDMTEKRTAELLEQEKLKEKDDD